VESKCKYDKCQVIFKIYLYFQNDRWFNSPQIPKAGYEFPARTKFKVEILDTWDMTITPVEGTFEIKPKGNYLYASDSPAIKLPGKPYMALRIRKVE
jgi:hypothetical protein